MTSIDGQITVFQCLAGEIDAIYYDEASNQVISDHQQQDDTMME